MAWPTLVTVVLPVRNGERDLGRQLTALAAQSYAGKWELLVVDNGCTDRTLEVVRGFAGKLLQMRVVDATARRGLNYARNAGVAAALADSPDAWARAHARAMEDVVARSPRLASVETASA
jgi:glycosyltransferase involved in cell wall biosynthesis